ncbi:MAG: hypothetical protein ACE5FJ_04075, partial [Gemmatimonadales bacterium]
SNTINQVRGILSSNLHSEESKIEEAAARLGAFGAGRIQVNRFESVLANGNALDPQSTQVIQRAFDRLQSIASGRGALTLLQVDAGENLHSVVARRLYELGAAFGAARVIDLAKQGLYSFAEHDRYLDGLPFAEWTIVERDMAPAMVISVDSADAAIGGLREFLDGRLKLIVVLRGRGLAAPGVSLISPRTYVLQSRDASELATVLAFDGPGAAVIGEDVVCFSHIPGAPRLADRLTIIEGHESEARRLGRWSGRQLQADVEQLVAMTAPVAANDAVESTSVGTPAGRLAAWLMAHAMLDDAE